MKVDGRDMRTIWLEPDGWSVGIIDQTALPHQFTTVRLSSVEDIARAMATLQVRGAPLIAAAAAYGGALALGADASDEALERACAMLAATRPTAVNLKWRSTKWWRWCATAPARNGSAQPIAAQ